MLITVLKLPDDFFTIETVFWELVGNFKVQIESLKGPTYAAKDIKLLYSGEYMTNFRRLMEYGIIEDTFVIAVLKPPGSEEETDEMEFSAGPSIEGAALERRPQDLNLPPMPALIPLGDQPLPIVPNPRNNLAGLPGSQIGQMRNCPTPTVPSPRNDPSTLQSLAQLKDLSVPFEPSPRELIRSIQYQAVIRRIMDLNFTQEQAKTAIYLADYNDVNRAVEYLIRNCMPISTIQVGPSTSRGYSGPTSIYPSTSGLSSRKPYRQRSSSSESSDENPSTSSREANRERRRRRVEDGSSQEMEAVERKKLTTRRHHPQATLPLDALSFEQIVCARRLYHAINTTLLQDSDVETIVRITEIGFSIEITAEAYIICNHDEAATIRLLVMDKFFKKR